MVDFSIVMLVFQGCVISWKFEDIEYYIFSGLLGVPAQTNYSDFWNGNSHVTYYQNFTQNTSQHTNKHFLLPWKTNMEPENTIEKGWKTSTHTTNFWVPVASKIEGVLATRGLQHQNFLGTWSFNENFSELSLPISPLREKEMIQLWGFRLWHPIIWKNCSFIPLEPCCVPFFSADWIRKFSNVFETIITHQNCNVKIAEHR